MTSRRTLRPLSTAGLLAGLTTSLIAGLVLVGATPASAEVMALTDPSGDKSRPGLDIVAVDLNNNDYRLMTTVDYASHRSGKTIVGVRARKVGLIRIVNLHDSDGTDRSFVLDSTGRVRCNGIRAGWDAEDAELTVSVPSRCLWSGNYGSVTPWVLTEPLDSGSDVDVLTTDAWVARG
ncbi:MAG TPA: hypothetical protein VFX15_14415 [Actinomycetes bacterium]|nr:hypothetical protein [Actinomycetes bacterium]